MSKTAKQEVGQLGEDFAVKHLVKHSFRILDRNYRKPWGEIDIIAKKDNILHFIEVKTVSYLPATLSRSEGGRGETSNPEENVHFWKRQRLARVIQTYLAGKISSDISDISDDTEWQVDVMAIFIDKKTGETKSRITENILL